MAFEELSENLKEQALLLKSRIEESRFVNAVNEKFSSFPKRVQLLIISFFCFLACLIILIYPINQYKASLEFEADYENRKDLSQKIISYAKTRSTQSPDPKKFEVYGFKSEFSKIATNIKLLDEQFSVSPGYGDKSKFLPKGAEENKFKISGNQFNLSQAIVAAYGIKNLSDSILLEGINIKPSRNSPEGNYFDVNYSISNFYVKPESELLPKAAPKKPKKKTRKR